MGGCAKAWVIVASALAYLPINVNRAFGVTTSTALYQSLGNGVRDNAVLFLNFLFYGLPCPKGLAMTEREERIAMTGVCCCKAWEL